MPLELSELLLDVSKTVKILKLNEIQCELDAEITDKENPPTKLYRFTYYTGSYEQVTLELQILDIVAYTPAGYWIGTICKAFPKYTTKEKWIGANSRKRFAYPTVREALQSLIIRKRKHVHYSNKRLQLIETTLKGAEELMETLDAYTERTIGVCSK